MVRVERNGAEVNECGSKGDYCRDGGDQTTLQYRDGDSQVVLSLGKKEFKHLNHQNIFLGADSQWLKKFDLELEHFKSRISEFPVTFPPSYPFEEEEDDIQMEGSGSEGTKDCLMGAGCRYMQTRCPSWCDRVLMSPSAKNVINQHSEDCYLEYGVIGKNACMGDHKPVFLKFGLVNGAGVLLTRPCSLGQFNSNEVKIACPISSPKVDANMVSNTITRYIHIKHSDSPVRIFKETTV